MKRITPILLLLAALPAFAPCQALLLSYRPQGYDAAFQAVLDRAAAEGFTLPSQGQLSLMNNLVLGLKAAGHWDKLDYFAIYEHDGAQGFNRINWKAPAGALATIVGAPSWSQTGGYTNTSNQNYIDTNFAVSSAGNFSQNAGSASIFLATTAVNTQEFIYGALDLNQRGLFLYNNQNNSTIDYFYAAINSTSNNYAISNTSEALITSILSSGNIYLYVNTTSHTGQGVAAISPGALDIYVGVLNYSGTPVGFCTEGIKGFWIGNISRADAPSFSDLTHGYFDNN